MCSTILIADDDRELLKMLKSFFEIRKYSVITAENGAEVLKMTESNPDIILLDVNSYEKRAVFVCREHERTYGA